MLYSQIKKGKKVSRLGLGTVQFGCDYGFSEKMPRDEVERILDKSRHANMNFLDTARDYGDSERKIGKYIKKKHAKSDFTIATKLTNVDPSTATDKASLRRKVFNSAERSLQELNIEEIDLLQLHQNDNYLLINKYFWDVVCELKKNRFTKFFGVSIYDVDTLKILLESKAEFIDCIQLPYNIFDRRFEKFFDHIRSYDIEIICRSAFLKGIIPAKNKDIPKELEGLLIYKDRLAEISEEYNFSISELCLLFTITNRKIMTTIIGVNSVEQLEKNIKAVEKAPDFDNIVLKELKKINVNNNFLIDPRRWNKF